MRNEDVADLIGNKHCYGLMAKKKDFDSRMKLLSKPIEVGASSPSILDEWEGMDLISLSNSQKERYRRNFFSI